jgi:hypothetical protein
VEHHGDVKVDLGTSGRPPRRGPTSAAAIVLLLIVLVGLNGFRGSDATAPREDLPDLGPDPLEAARLVVGGFAAAWNDGDVGALDGLIAADWDTILLPGLADDRLNQRDGRDELTDGLAFLTAVTTFTLGPCEVGSAPPASAATAVVHCEEAGFRGDYLDAVERNIWEATEAATGTIADATGITFRVRDREIIAVEAAVPAFTPQAYCLWAEETHPDTAPGLFDLHCHPVTTGATGPAHAELAGDFLAADPALPSHRTARARLAAGYVDRFAEHHNLGDTRTAAGWLSPEVPASGLPGFAGGPHDTDPAGFLPWSAAVQWIDIGPCSIETGDAHTIVTCPELTVSGPLVAGPLPQPTRFTLESSRTRGRVARATARIVEVEPLGRRQVPLATICGELRRSDPSVAEQVFSADCSPVYSREAGRALAAILES